MTRNRKQPTRALAQSLPALMVAMAMVAPATSAQAAPADGKSTLLAAGNPCGASNPCGATRHKSKKKKKSRASNPCGASNPCAAK